MAGGGESDPGRRGTGRGDAVLAPRRVALWSGAGLKLVAVVVVLVGLLPSLVVASRG